MPLTVILSSDPGREARIADGARILAIRSLQRTPDATAGLSVLGVVGSATNDRGVPNVPVRLGAVQDLLSKWGGFKAHVGDGDAGGYNGNAAALLWRLLAKNVVFQPVDMAIKDLPIATAGAVDLPVTIARGALAFTVGTDDVFACAGHPFVVDDTFVISQLLAGTGIDSHTTYHVIAPVVAGVSFKASLSVGGGADDCTVAGSGTLYPTAVATPDYDALVLPAGTRLVRKARAFNITHATSDETFTSDEPHGFIVGETVTLSALTGGTGVAAGDFVVATTPTVSTFTLTGVTTSSDITAGTVTRAVGAYVLRTLEDVSWAVDEYAPVEVRVAHVSGAACALNKVDGFHADDAPATASALVVATTDVTVPDTVDAAEIAARYQAALDAFDVNAAGKSANVLITDRTEAAINDALLANCAAAPGHGLMRIGVFAPPIGTSQVNAEAASGDGIARATLNTEFGVAAWPAITRRFDLDVDNLSVTDDYSATFPAHALLAAKIVATKPEENPTFVEAEPATTYGAAAVELALSEADQIAAYRAGYCVSRLELHNGRWVMSWKDGIMADGAQIATKRITDFVTAVLLERATPWHKRLASTGNREALADSCDTALLALKSPAGAPGQERIADYVLTPFWDPEVGEMTLIVQFQEVGNMNIITLRIGVSSSGLSALSGGVEEG